MDIPTKPTIVTGAIGGTIAFFVRRFWKSWGVRRDLRNKIRDMIDALDGFVYVANDPRPSTIKAFPDFEAECRQARQHIKKKNKKEFDHHFNGALLVMSDRSPCGWTTNKNGSRTPCWMKFREPLKAHLVALEKLT